MFTSNTKSSCSKYRQIFLRIFYSFRDILFFVSLQISMFTFQVDVRSSILYVHSSSLFVLFSPVSSLGLSLSYTSSREQLLLPPPILSHCDDATACRMFCPFRERQQNTVSSEPFQLGPSGIYTGKDIHIIDIHHTHYTIHIIIICIYICIHIHNIYIYIYTYTTGYREIAWATLHLVYT